MLLISISVFAPGLILLKQKIDYSALDSFATNHI